MTLAEQISCALFATRDSTKQAYDEVTAMISTLPVEQRAGALVAIHVLLNTIAKEMNDDK